MYIRCHGNDKKATPACCPSTLRIFLKKNRSQDIPQSRFAAWGNSDLGLMVPWGKCPFVYPLLPLHPNAPRWISTAELWGCGCEVWAHSWERLGWDSDPWGATDTPCEQQQVPQGLHDQRHFDPKWFHIDSQALNRRWWLLWGFCLIFFPLFFFFFPPPTII